MKDLTARVLFTREQINEALSGQREMEFTLRGADYIGHDTLCTGIAAGNFMERKVWLYIRDRIRRDRSRLRYRGD